ncbi:hypothetical protein E8E11_006273 [Didymella keratinophila]|nr:hypothetical protein E8E11_006273 [Didymella keratinophila]
MSETTSLVSALVGAIQNMSLLRIFLAVISVLIVRYISQGIYRVYFHPLRNFPGPKLSAASQLPKLIATWTGHQHQYIISLHAQYGEVVRASSDELSFIHPDAWRDIYGHGSGQGKGTLGSVPPKNWQWYGKASNGVSSLITEQNVSEHARVRRIFKPAFSDRALKDQEPLFMKYVEQLIGNLRKTVSEEPEHEFVMVKNYNFTTFDVMGDLTFGESLHMLDDSKYDPWVSVIFASIKFGSRFNLMTYYPWLARTIKANLPAKFQKKRYEHFQYSVERVTKRLDRGRMTKGRDLWDYVLGQEEGKQLSRGEMDANSTLFMIAGTETTATLLSGLTFLLLKNPSKMAALSDEIRGAFENEKDMSMEAIAALPYLAACLKEALRLYPPVPVGLPHLTPANGSTICGQYVPPGAMVMAPHYAMYTSPLNFKEPMSFAPERWLGDEKFDSDRKAALQPFSVGSRDCLGKNMAYHEMRLIITKVLYNFDMHLCPESEDWANQDVFTLWEKHPLMVRLKDVKA